VDLALEITALAQRLVDTGVSASTVEEQDYTPVVRARETIGDEPEDVRATAAPVRSALQGLG
jgi:hypothetical protein